MAVGMLMLELRTLTMLSATSSRLCKAVDLPHFKIDCCHAPCLAVAGQVFDTLLVSHGLSQDKSQAANDDMLNLAISWMQLCKPAKELLVSCEEEASITCFDVPSDVVCPDTSF